MVMIKASEEEMLRFEGDRDEVVWEVLDWARVLTAWREYEIDDEDPYWVIFEADTQISDEVIDNGVPGQTYTQLKIEVFNEVSAKDNIQNAVLKLINDRVEEPVDLADIIDEGEYEPEEALAHAVAVTFAVKESKTSTKH